MRAVGLILAIAGLLLAAGVTLLYPAVSPPLTASQELRKTTLELERLTGRAPVDQAELGRLMRAGQIDPARVEVRSHLTTLGLGIGGIGALLIMAGAISAVARKQQV